MLVQCHLQSRHLEQILRLLFHLPYHHQPINERLKIDILVSILVVLLIACFCSWFYMHIVYFRVLPLIKEKLPKLYSSILNGRDGSWIELGFYQGRSIGVQLRSLTLIYRGEANLVFDIFQFRLYKISVIVFLVGVSVSIILVLILFAVALSNHL